MGALGLHRGFGYTVYDWTGHLAVLNDDMIAMPDLRGQNKCRSTIRAQ